MVRHLVIPNFACGHLELKTLYAEFVSKFRSRGVALHFSICLFYNVCLYRRQFICKPGGSPFLGSNLHSKQCPYRNRQLFKFRERFFYGECYRNKKKKFWIEAVTTPWAARAWPRRWLPHSGLTNRSWSPAVFLEQLLPDLAFCENSFCELASIPHLNSWTGTSVAAMDWRF